MSKDSGDLLSPAITVIDYVKLIDLNSDLSREISNAFGPTGLGIVAIKNVPDFVALRKRLLPLAARFAQLPDQIKMKYEDVESSYNVGWSCGKEMLQNGTPDTKKGSFFANPLIDTPTTDPEDLKLFASYTRSNIWPREELPSLEHAFKELGTLIFDTGLLLSKHCDKYIAENCNLHPPARLDDILTHSPCSKGRLLCYLPPLSPTTTTTTTTTTYPLHTHENNNCDDSEKRKVSSSTQWCGWHTDHGSLTGLTSAMYINNNDYEREIECPDIEAGLHIQTREGKIVQAKIEKDCIAYQVGEAMQVLSGGRLLATPHCVVAPRDDMHALTRCTFALFMQPKWDHVMVHPEEVNDDEIGVKNWHRGITFGDFSKYKFETYYGNTMNA